MKEKNIEMQEKEIEKFEKAKQMKQAEMLINGFIGTPDELSEILDGFDLLTTNEIDKFIDRYKSMQVENIVNGFIGTPDELRKLLNDLEFLKPEEIDSYVNEYCQEFKGVVSMHNFLDDINGIAEGNVIVDDVIGDFLKLDNNAQKAFVEQMVGKGWIWSLVFHCEVYNVDDARDVLYRFIEIAKECGIDVSAEIKEAQDLIKKIYALPRNIDRQALLDSYEKYSADEEFSSEDPVKRL